MQATNLLEQIAALTSENAELKALVKYYEEQFRLSKHRQFGAKSEKSEYDFGQLSILNESELFAAPGKPEPVTRGSFASPEAIARIITQKFVLGVPLYRQEQDWNRQEILLSRRTMSNWLIRAAEDVSPFHYDTFGCARKCRGLSEGNDHQTDTLKDGRQFGGTRRLRAARGLDALRVRKYKVSSIFYLHDFFNKINPCCLDLSIYHIFSVL